MDISAETGVRASSLAARIGFGRARGQPSDDHDFPGVADLHPVGAPGTRFSLRGFAARLGLSDQTLQRLSLRARSNGTRLQAELAASGLVEEDALYRAMAEELGLRFEAAVDPAGLMVRDRDLPAMLGRSVTAAKVEAGEHETELLLAPDLSSLPDLESAIRNEPSLAERLRIVPRQKLRQAVLEWGKPLLGRRACDALSESHPHLSGRTVLNAWQGFAVGAGVILLPGALVMEPQATLLALHCFFSVFFFACVFLRIAAWWTVRPPALRPLRPVGARELPVYTVLVALRREAEIIPELLVALGRLVWPRSKLEIKLVCEADDHATLEAVRAQGLRSYVEVLHTPTVGPRTKPKALAYALQAISGEFVVLYDAEDRPHPLQLVEAWQRFSEAGDELACVQAPLVVSNIGSGLLPRLFAFEYAALFRGLLPWLSRKGLVLPLGGTSNHFRRSALDEVGGWDPYNVTEDADLGLRLHRFGYRTETITRPTYEDAPGDLLVWLGQRTRWFKGWTQTWLVHMRNPFRLWRELGPASFVICQVLFLGMVASALVHPLIALTAATVIAAVVLAPDLSMTGTVLLAIDAANLIFGYGAFLLLGASTLLPRERAGFWKVVAATPAYWLLMSAAAWRSIWQLYRSPHYWEKTPHRRRRRVQPDIGGPRQAAPVFARNSGPSPMTSGSSSPMTSSRLPA